MRRRVGPKEADSGEPSDPLPPTAPSPTTPPNQPHSPSSTPSQSPSTPEKGRVRRTWKEWGDEDCPTRFCCCDCCCCCKGIPRWIIYSSVALGLLLLVLSTALVLSLALSPRNPPVSGLPPPTSGVGERRRLLVASSNDVKLMSATTSRQQQHTGSSAAQVEEGGLTVEAGQTGHHDLHVKTQCLQPLTVSYKGANITVGHLVPSAPVESAQREGLQLLHRRQDELLAQSAAGAAAEVALGPALGRLMLQDMLTARGGDAPLEGAGEASSSCLDLSNFRRSVRGRVLLLVMHEASLTGAPLALAELAEQAVACGALKAQVVLLNWQKHRTMASAPTSANGDALEGQRRMLRWLRERGVEVLKGKGPDTWAAANASDIVILGSATCAPWLGGVLGVYPSIGARVVWWVMENRRRYFDMARPLLPRVAAAVFLSHHQAEAWANWASPSLPTAHSNNSNQSKGVGKLASYADVVNLPSCRPVVPLTLSPDLTPLSGLSAKQCSTQGHTPPKLLSTPGNPNFSKENSKGLTGCVKAQRARELAAGEARAAMRARVRAVLGLRDRDTLVLCLSSINPGKGQLGLVRAVLSAWQHLQSSRGVMDDANESGRLVLGVGSVGCKANKAEYVELLYSTVAERVRERGRVSEEVERGGLLWVESTLRVAPLYAAADAYVMNAQGMGETFGRVTVEAMAFGVPVLGTAAGGTLDIVVENKTGFLHEVGKAGDGTLSQDILRLFREPRLREEMGGAGRERVRRKFMGVHMYKCLGRVFDAVLHVEGVDATKRTSPICNMSQLRVEGL